MFSVVCTTTCNKTQVFEHFSEHFYRTTSNYVEDSTNEKTDEYMESIVIEEYVELENAVPCGGGEDDEEAGTSTSDGPPEQAAEIFSDASTSLASVTPTSVNKKKKKKEKRRVMPIYPTA